MTPNLVLKINLNNCCSNKHVINLGIRKVACVELQDWISKSWHNNLRPRSRTNKLKDITINSLILLNWFSKFQNSFKFSKFGKKSKSRGHTAGHPIWISIEQLFQYRFYRILSHLIGWIDAAFGAISSKKKTTLMKHFFTIFLKILNGLLSYENPN